VKKLLLSSAVMAALFAVFIGCLTSSQAQAQPQPPMSSGVQTPGGIALVDVNYIFKHHARLKGQLDDLRGEGEKVQKGFEEQMRAIQEQRKMLGGTAADAFKPGTQQYIQLEEKLVNETSFIQGQVALKRKEFIQREAHLYFNAYREISDEVKYFCEKNGIALVLNFNGDVIHEDNPDDIARGISNKVVYYNRNLDITPQILPRFAKEQTATPGGPYTPQPVR